MPILEMQIPGSEQTIEMDIGNLDPNGPEVKAMLQQAQKQYAPNIIQRGIQAAAGPAAAVRDVATAGAKYAVQGMGSMDAPMMTPGEQPPSTSPEAQQMAQMMAQGVVPQTPGQLASFLALSALGGPAAGMMTKGGGILARSIIPAMAQGVTEIVMEEVPSEDEAIMIAANMAASFATEGLMGGLKFYNRLNFSHRAKDKLGVRMAQTIGQGIGQVSSVKDITDPVHFKDYMRLNKDGDTLFHQEISKAMGEREKVLKQAVLPSMSQLTPPQRETARFLLEDVAGVEPNMTHAIGAPLHSAATVRVPTATSEDTLVEKALQRVRLAGQEMRAAEGAEKHQLSLRYDELKQELRGALAKVNPALAQQYEAMNQQFRVDLSIEELLKHMDKNEVWVSAPGGVHFNIAKAGETLQKHGGIADETGLLGGFGGVQMAVQGPQGVQGARAEQYDNIVRMFINVIKGAPPVSLAGRQGIIVTPKQQMTPDTARVRALSTWLGGQGGRQLVSMEGEDR